MARTPDKPGTYRVRPKGSAYVLSGVRPDGTRIKIPVSSQFEGETLASSLGFGGSTMLPTGGAGNPVSPTIPVITPPKLDEWGLPVVSTEQAAGIASAMGIPPTPPTPTVAQQDKNVAEAQAKAAEIQANRKKYAKSFCELVGVGYASGVVMGSQRLVTSMGRRPVNPSPKQVKDLSEVTADTIKEMFGDYEVKPWIMMIMLTLGIPLGMWIQSPKLPKMQREPLEDESPNLRSVT